MKRLLLIILFGLVAFVPVSALAATEIDQTVIDAAIGGTATAGIRKDGTMTLYIATGEYKLTSDLDLGNCTLVLKGGTSPTNIINTVIIDMNGFDIIADGGPMQYATIYVDRQSSLTLTGDGEISSSSTNSLKKSLFVEGHEITVVIDGPKFSNNVVFNGASIESYSEIHIKSGTFTNMSATNAKMIIDDGVFDGSGSTPTLIIQNGLYTINGGEFGGEYAVAYNASDERSTFIINGGKFVGGEIGLAANLTGLKISKGIFKGNTAGIQFNADGDVDATSLLAEGSYYSPDAVLRKEGIAHYTQTEIEVKKQESEQTQETTTEEEKKDETKNPKTGDNIMIYASLFGLSIVGLYILRKRFN